MKPISPIPGIMQGGKWKVVDEFRGRSHRDGGIDIEVSGGIVRRIHAPDSKPDEIAKSGSFWKSLGAGAYGVGEGLLDTITMGATDQLTDMGYEALQKAGGSTAEQIREQNSVRGYGTAAGAITGGIISGGAATGSAIQQGAKGIGAGVSQGSPESRTAQAIGTYLPLAGSVAGMATGNAGYAKGTKMASFAQKAGKVSQFNPLFQAGMSAFRATQPQPLNLGPVQQAVREITPYTSPGMMQGYRQLGEQIKGEAAPRRGTGTSPMEAPMSYGGVQGGPIQFQAQPIQQAEAFNYLSRYGING